MAMSAAVTVVLSADEIDAKAHRLIATCAWGSAGLGLVPLPFVDLFGVGGLQIWLVRELAKLHGVSFSGNRVKALVSALIGGSVPTLLTGGISAVVRFVPVVGPVIEAAVRPGLAGASTLAVGRVFSAHFKTGGTLLDFDVDKMKSFYEAELAKAATRTQTAST